MNHENVSSIECPAVGIVHRTVRLDVEPSVVEDRCRADVGAGAVRTGHAGRVLGLNFRQARFEWTVYSSTRPNRTVFTLVSVRTKVNVPTKV